MNSRLSEMQQLRRNHSNDADCFGYICKLIAVHCPADEFMRITDLVAKYGDASERTGYWDGAIAEMLGVCETPSEREAREYAEAAAASGQQEMGFRDPDDRRTNHGTG